MCIYLLVSGSIVPDFSSFGYYFMLDVLGITKFTYSMLAVIGFGCLLIGTQLFNRYFKDTEYRKLILSNFALTVLLTPLSFILVLRLNVDWGIPDMALIVFSDVVLSILSQCLVFLPISVIMVKICPKHIEATAFATLAGLNNFSQNISSWFGSWINEKFVWVEKDDLSRYWVLITIQFACCFIPLALIWLIPTQK